jgi:hypothetical protein
MINDPLFTPDHLRQAFINWRRGVFAPQIILESRFASGPTLYQADQHMHDVVDGVMLRHLRRNRITLGINHVDYKPTATQPLLDDVYRDFNYVHYSSPRHSRDLRAWSAVYHRLAVPISLPTATLAQAAQVDAAQFDRYVDLGLERLCDEMHQPVTWSIR